MKKIVWLVVILSLCLIPHRANALPVWLTQEENPYSVLMRNRSYFSTEAKAKSGHISINETEFQYSSEYKVKRMPLTVTASAKNIDINENLSQIQLPSHLVARSLLLGVKLPAPFMDEDHYFLGIDLIPSYFTDSWSEAPTSAFRFPFRTYLIYKESDDFILVGGLSVRPQFDTVILPILGVIWNPNDRLSFNFASDNPHIAYKLDDKTTLIVEGNFTLDEYEVTRNNQDGVVLKYSAISTGLGLEYKFSPTFQGTVSAGTVFNRRLEYLDGGGKAVPEEGLYANVQLTAHF